jgi:hypothetical protein
MIFVILFGVVEGASFVWAACEAFHELLEAWRVSFRF